MYYIQDGTEVTSEQIASAFGAGNAIMVHGYNRDGGIGTALAIDGIERDTRGECYAMSDEVWTTRPRNLGEALRGAVVEADRT